MDKIKTFVAILGLMLGVGFVVAPATVSAFDPFSDACKKNPSSELCKSTKKDDLPTIIKTAVNVMLYILGALSIVFIVIGGIQYTTSMGDANNIKRAKDTVLYSVIGLVVAIMAYAIVNYIIGEFT